MKDAFTAGLADVVQHQVELTSIIESQVSDQAAQWASDGDLDEVLCMLGQFNALVNRLIGQLAA